MFSNSMFTINIYVQQKFFSCALLNLWHLIVFIWLFCVMGKSINARDGNIELVLKDAVNVLLIVGFLITCFRTSSETQTVW